MDDNPAILDLLNQFLELLGHEDVGVANGELALQEIRSSQQSSNPIDVCILDLTIPGSLGGAQVAEAIRKEGLGIYTIASSGYSADQIRSEQKNSVFDDFLHKPYAFEELAHCLSKINPQRQ